MDRKGSLWICSYRELAESTMSFNRRLNEERRMRIPYIDGQVERG